MGFRITPGAVYGSLTGQAEWAWVSPWASMIALCHRGSGVTQPPEPVRIAASMPVVKVAVLSCLSPNCAHSPLCKELTRWEPPTVLRSSLG